MKLVTAAELRTATGESNFADILNLMGTAVEMITIPLQAFLRTPFDLLTYKDTFYLLNLSTTITKVPLSCVLNAGFLDAEYSVIVKVASRYADLSTVEEIDADYVLDYDKGVIMFPDVRPGNYVQVQYKAGFDSDSQDKSLYSGVPDWLKNAALMYSTVVYHRLADQKDHERSKEKTKKRNYQLVTEIPTSIYDLIATYMRWYPTMISYLTSSFV